MLKLPKQSWLWSLLKSVLLVSALSFTVFLSLIGMQLVAQQLQRAPLLQPLRGFIQNVIPNATLLNDSQFSVSGEEIRAEVDTLRAEQEVATLSAHVTLEKFSRLVSLEIEDQQDLALTNTQEILQSIASRPPQKVEILSLFAPSVGEFDIGAELAEEDVLYREDLTSVGIAARTATLRSIPGTIITIALSSDFPETVEPVSQPTTQRTTGITPPTFTGEDLWTAVQNYRRAHNLPEFAMSTELCTVASIRLNEQLELGRLDNHDGFQARSDQFFKDNPNWTNINENLAAGYQTAVQTVEWGWDQSLGHKALIQSREYPKACTAANRGFAVLITGK